MSSLDKTLIAAAYTLYPEVEKYKSEYLGLSPWNFKVIGIILTLRLLPNGWLLLLLPEHTQLPAI